MICTVSCLSGSTFVCLVHVWYFVSNPFQLIPTLRVSDFRQSPFNFLLYYHVTHPPKEMTKHLWDSLLHYIYYLRGTVMCWIRDSLVRVSAHQESPTAPHLRVVFILLINLLYRLRFDYFYRLRFFSSLSFVYTGDTSVFIILGFLCSVMSI